MAESEQDFNPVEEFRHEFLSSGLYHALYEASEAIGSETWGDNLPAHREAVEAIPTEQRFSGDFRMLLLGAATPTSIEQAQQALESWQADKLVGDKARLTVIDVNSQAYDRLSPEIKERVDFVRTDLRRPPFAEGSFNFVTSDYVLNFVPKGEILDALNGLSRLLKDGGVLTAAVETKKDTLLGRNAGSFFVRNDLSKEELDAALPEDSVPIVPETASVRGLSHLNLIGADRMVWGFQKIGTSSDSRSIESGISKSDN